MHFTERGRVGFERQNGESGEFGRRGECESWSDSKACTWMVSYAPEKLTFGFWVSRREPRHCLFFPICHAFGLPAHTSYYGDTTQGVTTLAISSKPFFKLKKRRFSSALSLSLSAPLYSTCIMLHVQLNEELTNILSKDRSISNNFYNFHVKN